MKLNMIEFETYLRNYVFNNNGILVYETKHNPELFLHINNAEFLYDLRMICFYCGEKSTIITKFFDYAEISTRGVTSIVIHTINNIGQKDNKICFWHVRQT